METSSNSELQNRRPADDSVKVTGIWQVLLHVFTKPSRAFESLKSKPRILIPLVTLIILTVIIVVATMRYSTTLQIDMLSKAKNLPPELFERMKQNSAAISPVSGAAIGAVTSVIFSLIMAGCAMFMGSVLFGGKSKFKAVWSVALASGLIQAFGGLLRLPLVFLKKSMLVSYGLAAFLPGKDFTSILYNLLYTCDIFMIWSVIVMGIGYAIIYDFPRSRGLTISIVATSVLIIFALVFRTIGLMLAGVEITVF